MLWVMSEADEYALPLAVAKTLKELCQNTGLNMGTVCSQRCRGRLIRWKGKAVRVEAVEELEDEEGE